MEKTNNKLIISACKILKRIGIKGNEYIELLKTYCSNMFLLNPISINTNYEVDDILSLVRNKSLTQIITDGKIEELEMVKHFYELIIEDALYLSKLEELLDEELIPEFINYKTENPSTKEMLLRDYERSIAYKLIRNNEAKDNFLEIANYFGISISDLYEYNGIDINHSEYLKPNSEFIKIPTSLIDISKMIISYDISRSFYDGTLDIIDNITTRRDYNYLVEMLIRLNNIRNFNFLETLKIIDDEEILFNIFSKYPLCYQYIMAPYFIYSGNVLDARIDELSNKYVKVKK